MEEILAWPYRRPVRQRSSRRGYLYLEVRRWRRPVPPINFCTARPFPISFRVSTGYFVVGYGVMAWGVMAMTRRGLPEPPTIFSGAAMTMAPVGGS
jgi:hypothetical protein